MDSNTHSIRLVGEKPGARRDWLAALAEVVDGLAAQDLDRLTDAAVADQVLVLRRLVDRLEGQWLQRVAAVDARGGAGAELGQELGSTAGWLRRRLRLGSGAASSAVRTARALFRGPLTQTARALCDGELSATHAAVVAHGTHQLPNHVTAEAEPILVEAAGRLDPPRLRRVLHHLQLVADPESADHARESRQLRRGLWLAPTWDQMVAVNGLLEPEAGQTLLAALEPLARPHSADDSRSGGQRTADALTELARRALEGGQLPQTGGTRPQLTVTVDLDSLVGPHGLGGESGEAGPLDPETCQRLACDSAVTRVLVTRQRPGQHGLSNEPSSGAGLTTQDAGRAEGLATPGPADKRLATRLRAAMALLPPVLGGAPTQPLEVGRASRVVQPAQRSALAVRDGGCVFPDCTRPLAWCEAHHLHHWLHGGPTDLANLALLCRAHHRAVHEGGWRLTRQPDGQLTAVPPHRRHRAAA